ncbi:MAG TPA: 4-alpha-glucanotransferase [Phycisphaerae bacterium]|nr:4-alpha-glucanotransferase [Phycisphaerae bacterium]
MNRSSGILLHFTSLRNSYLIGDIGPAARRFAELLAAAKQSWWQTLPLNPPAIGDSPYAAFSAFAGNPALLSPDDLHADGLLSRDDFLSGVVQPGGRIDYAAANAFKQRMLEAAHRRFREGRARPLADAYAAFQAAQAYWLEDYALFMALRERYPNRPWSRWPAELARRNKAALAEARRTLASAIDRHRFGQFLFFRQLGALRPHAAKLGVRFIGDMPIFVALESADAWAHPGLFTLGPDGKPTAVAGVPPDLFSRTGQRWGNPLYNWKAMAADGFTWWIHRLRAALEQADLVRIDHFRGFAACWTIPARARTAVRGEWVSTPGDALLSRLGQEFPGQALPLIAEDLGLITPDVHALREKFRLPGMRVLQFGFDGNPANPHLAHNITPDNVAYTGTHDNDTTAGWYKAADPRTKKIAAAYVPGIRGNAARALLTAAWATTAVLAIAPLQDVLGLPSAARMNLPGTPTGNWAWRAPALPRALPFLKELTVIYNRAPA